MSKFSFYFAYIRMSFHTLCSKLLGPVILRLMCTIQQKKNNHMCNNQNTNVCHHQLFLTLLYQSVYTDVCTGLPSLVVFISLEDKNKMEFENINHDIFIQCHACETSRCCACLVVQCLFITVSNGLPYKYTAYHITWRGYN